MLHKDSMSEAKDLASSSSSSSSSSSVLSLMLKAPNELSCESSDSVRAGVVNRNDLFIDEFELFRRRLFGLGSELKKSEVSCKGILLISGWMICIKEESSFCCFFCDAATDICCRFEQRFTTGALGESTPRA